MLALRLQRESAGTLNSASTDLSRLFAPRSIAVLGATSDQSKLGGQVVARLAVGFSGRLHPINPAAGEICGWPVLPRLADLPEPVDLLIALTPSETLIEAIERCPPSWVRFLLAIPSGFAEVRGPGEIAQTRLVAAARRAGMRLIGPNCVGLLNGTIGLNASIIPLMPPGAAAGLGIVTQSGGFGMATAMYAADSGLAVSRFCDVGNTGDLTAAELVEYLGEDCDTAVIGIFLESVHDATAFGAALARAVVRKPVILCPLARTTAGRNASLAHVGIAADTEALERQIPPEVVVVETGQALLDVAKAICWNPAMPTGRRVAIVTGTGGIGTEIADLASEHGLSVTRFSPALQDRLRRHVPSYAATANPVDLTPVWRDYPRIYPAVIDDIAASGEADLVLVSITDVPTLIPDLAQALAASRAASAKLPLLVFWGSRDRDFANSAALQQARVACYRSTSELVRAAAGLAATVRGQRHPP